MNDIIKQLYNNGDESIININIERYNERIDPQFVERINKQILPTLHIRPDYNGQPLLMLSTGNRIFLRTHPYYCFEEKPLW